MIIRVQGNRGKKYCVSNSKECFLSPIYIAFRCCFLPSRGWKSIISAQYVARFPSEVLEPTCQECTSSLLPSSTRCLHTYIYTYICTASKETIESDPRDIPPHSLDSISNVLFVRSWCIAWPSLLTPSLEECSTSDWRLARHGSCPRRAPCPTSSRIIIVEAEESSIASWNYFWQGKWWKKKMEETETSISFVLRSTVRLLQKLTSVSPYHSVLFYLKIRRFSTKFNQFRFLCFLYIYSLR